MIARSRSLNTSFRGISLRQALSQRRLLSYSDTVQNLRLTSETRVVIQGFTGKQATFDAKQSIEYGTKIVGGVRPGKTGEHLGLPVLPSMKDAVKQLKPDATAVYVAAPGAAAAIEEAIEAEVRLIVAVAEFIPLHDMIRVQEMLRTQAKSRLVGPNCPGMMNPHAKCRIGFPPIPFFQPGSVGIVSKSGTLSYETVASTTRAGVGQSLVVGIGGDPLSGTDFVDVLSILEHDENTKAIIIVGEIGGEAEQRAAEWILDYKRRNPDPKPIVGLVAGVNAPTASVMGHAGAMIDKSGRGNASEKLQMLEKAGVILTDHPEKFGGIMKSLLATQTRSKLKNPQTSQKRTIHTHTRPAIGRKRFCPQPPSRQFHVVQEHFDDLLKSYGLLSQSSAVELQLFVDRSSGILAVAIQDVTSLPPPPRLVLTFARSISDSNFQKGLEQGFRKTNLMRETKGEPKLRAFEATEAMNGLATTITQLAHLFKDKEASVIEAGATYDASTKSWTLLSANGEFDPSAYKSSKRQQDIYKNRSTSTVDPAALEAEPYGIVYVRLPGDCNVGTLVNGAGLAMNTVDALTNLGGRPTNFLDTGGKATSDTVSQSFRTILSDSRVKAIFVNIFGGLTLCDMIARGILMAYKDVGIQVPVVVRLRGTNEKDGQKLIAESGLPVEAFDEFEEAARRVIELADGGSKI